MAQKKERPLSPKEFAEAVANSKRVLEAPPKDWRTDYQQIEVRYLQLNQRFKEDGDSKTQPPAKCTKAPSYCSSKNEYMVHITSNRGTWCLPATTVVYLVN